MSWRKTSNQQSLGFLKKTGTNEGLQSETQPSLLRQLAEAHAADAAHGTAFGVQLPCSHPQPWLSPRGQCRGLQHACNLAPQTSKFLFNLFSKGIVLAKAEASKFRDVCIELKETSEQQQQKKVFFPPF